jgi:hypothetical protein
MSTRTRTIWEGRCPVCGENGCVPDNSDNKVLEMSRWCRGCQRTVDCAKVSYTGPELEPVVPNVHHVWCNGQRGPVKGCRWCCKQDPVTGLWDGLWTNYPYDPAGGPPADFTEKHFPHVMVRR